MKPSFASGLRSPPSLLPTSSLLAFERPGLLGPYLSLKVPQFLTRDLPSFDLTAWVAGRLATRLNAPQRSP